jgi:signal transduction histidine kinase
VTTTRLDVPTDRPDGPDGPGRPAGAPGTPAPDEPAGDAPATGADGAPAAAGAPAGRPGPWRLRLAVAAAGLAVAVASGWAQHLPADDMAILVATSFGVALLAGAVGHLGLALLGTSHVSLRAQAVVVGLVSVVGTAVGTLAAARAMFVSSHDLAALLTVLAAAGTVGVLGAVELGGRVSRASDALAALTRRIADGEGTAHGGAGGSAELAALAAELEDMGRRLEASRARERTLEGARRELVAWVSHDLRTPLAGIRAMSEALTDGVVTDADTVARYHATIQSETERLAALVDDLFELSRIHADAVTLTLGRASLGDVVSDALASARPVAEARGVRLDGRVTGAPPPVRLASQEMGRVLQNLLDNAIRHTPAGGTVTVDVRDADDRALVTVRDECGGIPARDLDRVFDLAYRGDAARSPGDDHRGAGLGLAIARGLVEAHDGDIAVRNDDGGCRFTVRLPLDPDGA